MPAISSIYSTPGTYLQESTTGAIPTPLSQFKTVYMLGHSDQVGAPTEPTYIGSSEDFFNVFGASASRPSVDLYFSQRSGEGLWFVNVPTRPSRTVTVGTATVGGTYSLTIAGFLFSYVAVTGDTTATILNQLASLVNGSLGNVARLTNGVLRYQPGTVITASANVTLGTETSAGAYPTVDEVIDVINTAFTTEMGQGFLLADEFFAQSGLTTQQHNSLANAMEAHCSDPRFSWVSLVPCSRSVATASYSGAALQLALTEETGISSPRGHSWYYAPWVIDNTNTSLPATAAIAGLAIRRFRAEGFRQPAAGAKFPLFGVSGLTHYFDDKAQSQVNLRGINLIRKLPNLGIVAWGARTSSTDAFFQFGATRVILNVLLGTLRTAFDNDLFSSVDGQGALFSRIKGTCVGVCERLRLQGALYGATPDEAYRVIVDSSNNNPQNLDNGIVVADLFVKPSPVLEVLVLRVTRTGLADDFDQVITFDLSQPSG